MISPEKVMVPLRSENILAIVNLVRKTVEEIPFSFMGFVDLQLYLFDNTNLICVQEQVKNELLFSYSPQVESRNARLTYLSMTSLSRPCFSVKFVNKSLGHVRTFNFVKSQGNNHSLVYFFKNDLKQSG